VEMLVFAGFAGHKIYLLLYRTACGKLLRWNGRLLIAEGESIPHRRPARREEKIFGAELVPA
jgi:hypothetical protein